MSIPKDSKNFNFYIPLDISKASNGDWRIKGLASTEHMDLQGEIVRQNSLDITPLKDGKGLLNWDHQSGPENVIGAVDKADMTDNGLMVEGYLFKNSARAKSIHEILTSLKDKDKNRLQMSIEGKILRRAGMNGKEIAAARIDKVALTFDPVNPNTYAELVKSLTAEVIVDQVVNADSYNNVIIPENMEIIDSHEVLVTSEDMLNAEETINILEAKELIHATMAKTKQYIENQCLKSQSKNDTTSNNALRTDRGYGNSPELFDEVKKAIKEKVELFIKSKDSVVLLGHRILQLWDQTGMIGNVYEQETIYYQFKTAVDAMNVYAIKELLPEVLIIWRDEGLGVDEVESQALYNQAINLVQEVKKALMAGDSNVSPSELTDGASLKQESLLGSPNKKNKKKKKLEKK